MLPTRRKVAPSAYGLASLAGIFREPAACHEPLITKTTGACPVSGTGPVILQLTDVKSTDYG